MEPPQLFQTTLSTESPDCMTAIVKYKAYIAFLQPKQSRNASEWHVLTGSQFLPATHTTILTLLRKHSPDGTTRTRRHTSDIVYYSTNQPRKDEGLSWPSWPTYSGRFIHISGHPSAAGRTCGRVSSPVKDRRSTAVPHSQHSVGLFRQYFYPHPQKSIIT